MINDNISSEKVALVITPPELYGSQLAHRFRARTTLGVLTQLIAQAETHIVIASPFLQSYEGLAASPLIDALKHALQRGVHLDVIVTGVGIDIFRTKWTVLLGDGRIRLFQPKPNVDDDKLLGSHAKILITFLFRYQFRGHSCSDWDKYCTL
jgi:phosphatidylserine/phosphatidylglycerophosphate/cardiolipin synthase-like enzyme